jgi:hypothetical protein
LLALSRALLAAVLLAVLFAAPAAAQGSGGFFASLFGGAKPKPAEVVPAKPGKPLKLTPVLVPKPVAPKAAAAPETKAAGPQAPAAPQSPPKPSFVTMCVRLCDGYYFPVSSPTRPANLRKDRDLCEQTCSVPARLYVLQSPGGSAAQMRDLNGNPYKKLKTAFLYRKKLVPNCSCRAAPWSEAELARHSEYALHEGTRRMMEELEAEMAAAGGAESEEWDWNLAGDGESEVVRPPVTKDGPNPPAVRVVALIRPEAKGAKPGPMPQMPAIAIIKVSAANPHAQPQLIEATPAVVAGATIAPPAAPPQLAVLKATKTSPGGALAFRKKVFKDPRELSVLYR